MNVMVALAALVLLLPPLVGLGVAGRSRMIAMRDADRLCRGYW